MSPSPHPPTLLDAMHRHAEQRPEKVALRLFRRADEEPVVFTYERLWRDAARWAGRLRDAGLVGERVLLTTKTNDHFVPAFFGCLMAGAVAVPTPPAGRRRTVERLRVLAADSGARALVTDFAAELPGPELAGLTVLDSAETDAVADGPHSDGWRLVRPESLAFLQYTSGSTGSPKGVMITHGNLVANMAAIAEGMALDSASRMLSFLPLFHDMGLIGGMLEMLYLGAESTILPAQDLVVDPALWPRLVSDLRITVSGGPNFMYDLTADAGGSPALDGVDLSSWKVAFCGAEPIRAATVERFVEAYRPRGFRPSTFYPCYGMAEATLFVTGVEAGAGVVTDDGDGRAPQGPAVGCGHPRADMRVEIVDPKTRTRPRQGQEGEIWLRSASISPGYWNRPDLSHETFGAVLADTGEGPFLRTGDLGYQRDGQLFVTGRLKDLIIIRGRNVVPMDLEAEAETSHEAVVRGGCVAVPVEDETVERVVLGVELGRGWLRRPEEHDAIRQAARAAVFSATGIAVHEVVLLKPYAIPRTTSGKLRRSEFRGRYLTGTLDGVVAAVPSGS
ncbi:fatty acyl-AMP ligase [Streptomyces sp. NPDC056373]|uniref:fatty acyl-AMP ligase n=1 Tax=Streptomyces sp. NPDC056373 TaxID=3345798 RepID=UPI0035DD59E4